MPEPTNEKRSETRRSGIAPYSDARRPAYSRYWDKLRAAFPDTPQGKDEG